MEAMSETEMRHCDGCGKDYSVADERHDMGNKAHLLTKTGGAGGFYTTVTPTPKPSMADRDDTP